jgi:trehalose-6-phosphatase
VRAVRGATERLARASGLSVPAGSIVSEVRTPNPDKGDSLKAFLNVTAFTDRKRVLVRDDLTDEHRFDDAEVFGGCGSLVCRPRHTAARHRFASVPGVRSRLPIQRQRRNARRRRSIVVRGVAPGFVYRMCPC